MPAGIARLLLGLALLLPGLAPAQLLDFENACGSGPPCALDAQFAPHGIAFLPTAPTTLQVVAGGTDGLTGTQGGAYARISTAPTQVVIQLSRVATFVSFNVARASSSSMVVTLAVSMFKSGVQVGTTQTLLLGTVNNWASLAFSNAGGFDAVLLSATGGANTTFGIDNLQFGGRCNGFADVAPSDSFCNAAEWLANRGVTNGCTTGHYCPSGVVTRGQMALFLSRLGAALVPAVHHVEQAAPSGWMSNPASGTDMCIVGPLRVTAPKVALLNGRVSVTTAGAAGMTVRPSVSVDGGPFATTTAYLDVAGTTGAAGLAVNTSSPPTQLLPGRSYRFSVFPFRSAGSGSFSAGYCKLLVTLLDANGGTAPYDIAEAP